jgi:hypothetical protein
MNVQLNIGSNPSGSYKDVNITFPKPFGNVPAGIPYTIIVIATIVLDNINYPLNKHKDRYSVNVANITKNGFTARITRLDTDEGWGMDLNLNYIATTCTIFN